MENIVGKRNTEEDLKVWRSRIREWEDSKLSMVKWCSKNNETIDTLRYWKERVYVSEIIISSQELKSKQEFKPEKFLELSCEENVSDSNTGIEICIKDISIKITQNFEEGTLTRLLHLLRRAV